MCSLVCCLVFSFYHLFINNLIFKIIIKNVKESERLVLENISINISK